MDIPQLESAQLILDDSRRLTGPSLVSNKPGAILDVLVKDMDMDRVLDCWYRHINALLAQLDCSHYALAHRRFENGFNLLLEAPIDQLYSAVLTLETAWYFCVCELLQQVAQDRAALLQAVRESMQQERNPALIDMQQAAFTHQVDFLVDEDYLCVGHGSGSASWPIEQIPAPQQVDWDAICDIPLALVTGTNGKSTSVRLLDSIARAAGQVSGITSTDFVRVGDDMLERGDYSGPGGARLLLRDKRVQVAFLEVARGGILRRGLALQHARAALVTNVARDHLGQYGVNSLQALTQAKMVVRKALGEDGVLVLNADDDCIRAFMDGADSSAVCWFSLERENTLIQQQLTRARRCCFSDGGEIIYADADGARPLCQIRDIPMTLDGTALHNVRNVLGAVGIACAMHYSAEPIRRGLASFRSDAHDNPGRLNLFELKNGARVVVDYAHNAHGIEAVVGTVKRMPAKRRWALSSCAGDRSDEQMGAIAAGIASLEPQHVVIVELEHYLRGREPGEVTKVLRQAYLDSGLEQQQLLFSASPLRGVELILQRLEPGDLALLLVLDEREAVIQLIDQYTRSAG